MALNVTSIPERAPVSLEEAKKRPDHVMWKLPVNVVAIDLNQMWTIAEKPPNAKLIGCKGNGEPMEPSDQKKVTYYLSFITVEPVMMIYNLAFMLTLVVEQHFYAYKACTVNHGYNRTVCDNLIEPQYDSITKEVQVTVAHFLLWNSKAAHFVPIILALFVGAWSDRRGRKLPLLIGLLGKLYFYIMMVINATQSTWPLEYVIYTATLPMAFTGSDVTIFALAFTYMVDITSSKNRTMRVTILEVCFLAAKPTGIGLGSYMFVMFQQSHTIMFLINVLLVVLVIVYTYLRLEWRSNPKQMPFPDDVNKLFDFFDCNHVVDTVIIICKKRPSHRRMYLIVFFWMFAFFSFLREERDIMYLYCQLVFHWTIGKFSYFRTFHSAIQVIVLVIVPFTSRITPWRDTIYVMVGAVGNIIARIFYAFARDMWTFYAGILFASVGPIIGPVIRSKISKIVSSSEKGKTFSVLAVIDHMVPVISGIVYSDVYEATIYYDPSAFYYVTIATQLGVLILILYIHFGSSEEIFADDLLSAASIESTTSTYLENEGGF